MITFRAVSLVRPQTAGKLKLDKLVIAAIASYVIHENVGQTCSGGIFCGL